MRADLLPHRTRCQIERAALTCACALAVGLLASLAACAPRVDSPIDAGALRDRMVREQIEARGVRDPRVLAAMREVPRDRFVPAGDAARAHDDRPLPIGHRQTISQPYIVASMTELVDPQPGDRVLEIGTGSGYQAAVLAEITPHVWTIEIVEELGRRAAQTLRRLGYDSVQCRIGDGYHGWPEQAPFDAIIVTAAPETLPAPLAEQLVTGGRLCIPVGAQGEIQELRRYTKNPDGSLEQEMLESVRFVPMIGAIEQQPIEERE
ncbi:MAG: protein-L-isoaspartate(D-aspartate) O-methyltransferase [Myxococcota bacterium]|nr:protein-L-isoaspartate(D-aspartate) O-methyltransferase [Myxococcota bacterium]